MATRPHVIVGVGLPFFFFFLDPAGSYIYIM